MGTRVRLDKRTSNLFRTAPLLALPSDSMQPVSMG
jgi:hypothetical protein